DTYRDIITLKRRRDDDADKDEEPSAGSDRGSAGKSTQGSKSRQMSASDSATAEEHMQTTFEIEKPSHPEFDTGADDQLIVKSSQHPEWFSQKKKPPTPDRNWNKTLPATHRSIQPWISELAKKSDFRSSFNKMMDTPVDFFNFLMNWLRVDTLTPKLLAGPTDELMKGLCKSLPFEIAFLELVKLIIVPSYRYPIQVLIVMPLDNLEFSDSDDSLLRIHIASRLLVDSKIVELLTFTPLMGDSPEGMLVNKDKQYRLMRIDELHKFNDGMFTDVRTALDDRLKEIRIKYLPRSIWRKSDKDRVAAMIQAIDKRLKTMRIMTSLERFVGGRSKSENMEIVPTEMELILEHTQQGISHEVSEKSEKVGRVPTEMELILEHTQQDISYEVLVANAARNYEILHERDDDDAERPDKRQKSGDRHQPTTQQSSHRNHGHNNDRHGSDRRDSDDNHRSNNNYSGNNNRSAGSLGLRRFFRYAMFIYSFYLCYSLSLYLFTERYAQPYFLSCLIRQNVRLVELCTLRTIVVMKGVLGIRSFVILIKHPTCLNVLLRIVLSVETRLMVNIVKDVLISERNLRKICLHIVSKMKFSKILPSHPITIPMLLMLFKSHSLSNKTPIKIPHKVLHKLTTIVVTGVVIR
nr:hypothetical protein [Tanacetum cinerariifolium]